MLKESRFAGLKRMYRYSSLGTDYTITYSEIDKYIHIRIHRDDSGTVFHWMDIQEIKNQLLGENKIAIQVYPRSDQLVNNGNTCHIWSWDDMEVPNLKELYNYAEE